MNILQRAGTAVILASAGQSPIKPPSHVSTGKRGSSTPAAFPPTQSAPSTNEEKGALPAAGFNDLNHDRNNRTLTVAAPTRNYVNSTTSKKKGNSLFKRAAALFCDALESAVVERFQQQRNLGGLSGNFAPAEEYGPSPSLPVIGTLPGCLNGEFLRVGPNPKFKPKGNYSWFDGDGMLHGLRIQDGKVTYTSRYVRTSRLSQEEYYGAAMFVKAGDCSGRQGLFWVLLQSLRVRLGLLDISNGSGTANTALVFHNGQLLCLQETDRPYSIRVHDNGDLETIGLVSYDEKLNHPFTAHPKVDPETGEMFVLGNNLAGKPFVTYRVVSKGGEMRDPVVISTSSSDPLMMHDFAITEHYAVFMDCPLYFRPVDMVMKNQGLFFFDERKPTRFGILPRYAGDESSIRWFELPACMILHTANAWEEGDEEIVLVACRSPSVTLESINSLIENDGESKMELVNDLYEFRFNLKSGKASQKQLGEILMDFPGINPMYRGRKNRFVYTSFSANPSSNAIVGIAKFDLTLQPDLGKEKLEPAVGNIAGLFTLGDGRYGSEAVFVPAENAKDEDEGYLVVFVHDLHKGRSEAVVIDAHNMSADPVAVIQLPTRVPYGFHGLFVSERQLSEQRGRFFSS